MRHHTTPSRLTAVTDAAPVTDGCDGGCRWPTLTHPGDGDAAVILAHLDIDPEPVTKTPPR